MKHSVQEAEKQKGEKIKESFTTENIWSLVHSLILFSGSPRICAMALTGDKGEKTGAWVCSFSLFPWFQFSSIAGNLVFNINEISPFILSCCFILWTSFYCLIIECKIYDFKMVDNLCILI